MLCELILLVTDYIYKRVLEAATNCPTSSTNRSYGYFPPPPSDRDTALYVGCPHDSCGRTIATVGDIGECTCTRIC